MRIFSSRWFQRFEERQFNEAAKHVLALTEKHLAELVIRGDFTEVKANEQEISK